MVRCFSWGNAYVKSAKLVCWCTADDIPSQLGSSGSSCGILWIVSCVPTNLGQMLSYSLPQKRQELCPGSHLVVLPLKAPVHGLLFYPSSHDPGRQVQPVNIWIISNGKYSASVACCTVLLLKLCSSICVNQNLWKSFSSKIPFWIVMGCSHLLELWNVTHLNPVGSHIILIIFNTLKHKIKL